MWELLLSVLVFLRMGFCSGMPEEPMEKQWITPQGYSLSLPAELGENVTVRPGQWCACLRDGDSGKITGYVLWEPLQQRKWDGLPQVLLKEERNTTLRYWIYVTKKENMG